MSVRVFVDGWDPSYGSPLDPVETGPAAPSSAALNLDVELPAAGWHALSPPPDARAPDVVLLVDGVRRVDARVWVQEADDTLHPGVAASYAAGVVRCDLRHGCATVVTAQIQRGLFTPSPGADDLVAANARYHVHRVAGSEIAQLTTAIQPQLQALEAHVAAQARAECDAGVDDLLVVDGPLHRRTNQPRALGYIKTHRVQYLPAEHTALIGHLRPGQRSPVFLLGTSWHRHTWYLKLPGPPGSPWAGVVRVEASADLSRSDVIGLADQSAVTLPRFASTSYKDARAPQNLTPIAGLERRLRTMLGDQRLLLRSLTAAAAGRGPHTNPDWA